MRNNLQHPINCEAGELNPPATAPDSAMRVAERICRDCFRDGDTSQANHIATLVRQAGSERERELTRRLQITLADIDTLLEIADSNVHPKVIDMIKLSRAEASRLLGGNRNDST